MRKNPFQRVWITIALIGIILPAAALAAPEESLTQRLARNAARYDRLGLAGVIAAQYSDQPPAIVGVGLADRRSRTPHTAETLFDLGIVSTQFTAAAILRLRMAGDLDLGTPISKLLKGVPVDKSEITIEQLLTHRSGLPEFVAMHAGDANHMDRALQRILEAPLDAPPGQTTRFSASGYTLLAMIIARISGENFPDYIRREVFEASGMRDGHFLHDTDVDASLVALRYADPAGLDPIGSALTNRWSWETRGVSGVVASADDLLTFINATREGDFFDDEARAIFWRPDSGGRSPAGLHFESMSGTTRILASGQSNGFEASVAVFPQEDITVILLANCNGVLAKVGPEIEKTILFPDAQDEPPPPPATLARLEGRYRLDDGSTLDLTASADAVIMRASGQIALERLVHGDRFEPTWSVFYAQMNQRALEAAAALSQSNADAVQSLMGREATRSDADQLIAEYHQRVTEPTDAIPESLGTVSLDDSMVSFVRIADDATIALHWQGRDLAAITSDAPHDLIAIDAREVRKGLIEGPAGDGLSAVRLAYDQPGTAPIDAIKLLATKSAGAVMGERVEEE